MKTKLLILCALFLTACGRRNLNGPATTLPPPAVATNTTIVIQTEVPTTAPEATNNPEPTLPAETTQAVQPTLIPTLEPTVTRLPPLPSATLAPQGDPLGDELEGLLGELESTNAADEQEINNLATP